MAALLASATPAYAHGDLHGQIEQTTANLTLELALSPGPKGSEEEHERHHERAKLYFERAEQVFMPRWSSGRTVILGDTAWAGPTGMGTTLALLGAHVLAGELAVELVRAQHAGTTLHPACAYRAYEHRLRPYVEKTQRVPPGVPGLALPTS